MMAPSFFWIVIAVLVGLFGLAIGSFLNVVIYRVPVGASVVSPPSACPGCGHQIRALDNIPVLSWLMLRGRCRSCKAAISTRYPLVEASTAVAFGGVAAYFLTQSALAGGTVVSGPQLIELLAFLYLAAVSIALALIDLDVHRLPNAIVLPSYLVGFALLATASIVGENYEALIRAGVSMAALTGLYLLLALISRGGMGLGDVKLAGLLGVFLGWTGWGALIIGSFVAFILGGVFGLVLIAFRRARRKSGIPFGPWMLAGAWIGIFVGDQIWGGYLSLLGA